MKEQAISVFKEAHPGCQVLFIFDQSSAHASLPPNALKAFEMNKENRGKQRRQKDTVVPETNSIVEHWQDSEDDNRGWKAKGLEQTLYKCGFNVDKMHAKCALVCPWNNNACCMVHLLSKQDDFVNQVSMLVAVIKDAGHKYMFLPIFHCELNLIKMVCLSYYYYVL